MGACCLSCSGRGICHSSQPCDVGQCVLAGLREAPPEHQPQAEREVPSDERRPGFPCAWPWPGVQAPRPSGALSATGLSGGGVGCCRWSPPGTGMGAAARFCSSPALSTGSGVLSGSWEPARHLVHQAEQRLGLGRGWAGGKAPGVEPQNCFPLHGQRQPVPFNAIKC